MFECKKCGNKYTRKHNLNYHTNKYPMCDVIVKKHTCKYCDKGYCRNDYLNKHIEKMHNNILLQELQELKSEVKELKASMNSGQQLIHIDNSTNITNNIDNSTNITLNVNAFQRTSMDHLDEKLAYKAFVNLFHYLPYILSEITFNKDHPENHNVYLKNVKNKIYKVFDGLGFQEVSENIFFKHFIDNYINMFDSHISKLIDENKIVKDEKKYEIFENTCSELEYLAIEHKNNLKKNAKYRKLYDSLLNVFTSGKKLVKYTMDNQESEKDNGDIVKLEYKDDTVYQKYLIH